MPLHPIIRLSLSFFTLAQAGEGHKNLGFGFAAFRDRAVLERFCDLMSDVKISPWSKKRLCLGLAFHKTGAEVEEHFSSGGNINCMQLSRAHWSLNLFKFNYMTLSRLDEHCKAINALWDKNNTVSKRPGGGAAGGRPRGGAHSKSGGNKYGGEYHEGRGSKNSCVSGSKGGGYYHAGGSKGYTTSADKSVVGGRYYGGKDHYLKTTGGGKGSPQHRRQEDDALGRYYEHGAGGTGRYYYAGENHHGGGASYLPSEGLPHEGVDYHNLRHDKYDGCNFGGAPYTSAAGPGGSSYDISARRMSKYGYYSSVGSGEFQHHSPSPPRAVRYHWDEDEHVSSSAPHLQSRNSSSPLPKGRDADKRPPYYAPPAQPAKGCSTPSLSSSHYYDPPQGLGGGRATAPTNDQYYDPPQGLGGGRATAPTNDHYYDPPQGLGGGRATAPTNDPEHLMLAEHLMLGVVRGSKDAAAAFVGVFCAAAAEQEDKALEQLIDLFDTVVKHHNAEVTEQRGN